MVSLENGAAYFYICFHPNSVSTNSFGLFLVPNGFEVLNFDDNHNTYSF